MQSKTLINLHRQEARLSRRLALLQPHLDRLFKVQAHRRNVALQQKRIEGAFAEAAAPESANGGEAPDSPPVRLPRAIFRRS